jgi:hypothetical protein
MNGKVQGKSGSPNSIRGTIIPELHDCLIIDDITFALNKSYLRPARAHTLEIEIQDMRKAGPSNSKLHIFGHTDNVDNIQYNKYLSERRARSVYSFITQNPGTWVDLHLHEAWGVLEVQETIDALKKTGPGGPASQITLPMEAYLGKSGKRANRKNLERLYADYMKHFIAKPFDPRSDFCGLEPYDGCSEFNPLVAASVSRDKIVRDRENEPNRRVAIFLFEPNASFPCRANSLAPCYNFRYKPSSKGRALFECEFYDVMIDNGTCSSEKKPKPPSALPPQLPSPVKAIEVSLGFPEADVDPIIIKKHELHPSVFSKFLEVHEMEDSGEVVAFLPEEIISVEEEAKGKGVVDYKPKMPFCLVKTKVWYENAKYYQQAEVIIRETKEKLFGTPVVNAPHMLGGGYYEKSGKYVKRKLFSGREPRPSYDVEYINQLGLIDYQKDITLMLRIENGARWKEYPNITERVKDIMRGRGFQTQ